VTAETVRDICNLQVLHEQKGFVAPNAVSIAQAYFEPNAWFRAIYAGEVPVGFVMLYISQEESEYFLWRYMLMAIIRVWDLAARH
jgi:diamine N-acetyltransferase